MTCAHGWQFGGGLYIYYGTATLTDANVYENQAHVRSPVEPSLSSHPTPHWNVTCAHGWQYGGGLYIGGMATLTDTNVYENQAEDVCSRLLNLPCALSSTAAHSTDRRCCARAHMLSHAQGGCNIFSYDTLTLRNISVASSQSSCPSGRMLDLAEATTIHCPLGWWVQAGLKVVLVHENDKEKGGCEFGDFFGTTPQELIDDGIFRLACT